MAVLGNQEVFSKLLTSQGILVAFLAFHPFLEGLLWNFNYTDNLLQPIPVSYDWGLSGYAVLR